MKFKLNNEHFSDSKSCLDSLVLYLDFSVSSTERLSDEAIGKTDSLISQFRKWWDEYLSIKEKIGVQTVPALREFVSKLKLLLQSLFL